MDMSAFRGDERVLIMSDSELEEERRKAAYLEKLDKGYQDAMNGNFIPMTSAELRAYVND